MVFKNLSTKSKTLTEALQWRDAHWLTTVENGLITETTKETARVF